MLLRPVPQYPHLPPCFAVHRGCARTGFLSSETRPEEAPRQQRQSPPATHSTMYKGCHDSYSSPGPLLVAAILACGEITLEYQTFIFVQGNLTNPFHTAQAPKTHIPPLRCPRKHLDVCLFRYLPNQHLQWIITLELLPFWTSLC